MTNVFYHKSCVFNYAEEKDCLIVNCVNCSVVRKGHGSEALKLIEEKAEYERKKVCFLASKDCPKTLEKFLIKHGYSQNGKYFKKEVMK